MEKDQEHPNWASAQSRLQPEGRNINIKDATSFFLELLVTALLSSPVAYWIPSNLGSSSSAILFFCLFILSMGFSRQEHCSGLLFPPPVDHSLSVLFTVTFWVALPSMAHHFTELCKTLHHKAETHERTLSIREA